MALTPELKSLKDTLTEISIQARTPGQQNLLEELRAIDTITLRKNIEESTFSATRMTSPGGECPCCGR